jgi:hypothetical protein
LETDMKDTDLKHTASVAATFRAGRSNRTDGMSENDSGISRTVFC